MLVQNWWISENKEILTAADNYITDQDSEGNNEDLTEIFREKLEGAEISLNGCQTVRGEDSIAKKISNVIPESTVDGGAGLAQMQVPFTENAFGKKNVFKKGEKVNSMWGF